MPSFGVQSKAALAALHPDLQRILTAAIKKIDFRILDAIRGKAAQERAFAQGHSKAHFGQSAHNYEPAVACDLFPAPYDWNNRKAFRALYDVIGRYDPKTGKGKGLALEMKIPLRCGIDWNMDDDVTTSDSWDGGHYELHPWRSFAKTLTKRQ